MLKLFKKKVSLPQTPTFQQVTRFKKLNKIATFLQKITPNPSPKSGLVFMPLNFLLTIFNSIWILDVKFSTSQNMDEIADRSTFFIFFVRQILEKGMGII
jgi:hypothetical protein